MREIKFRAWFVAGGRMITVDKKGGYAKVESLAELFRLANINTYKLMQYTGLKDKNGVEIYEGDIITVTTNHVADLDPKYPEKTTTVEVRCENAVWWFGDMTMIYTPLKNAKLEVIGNIYENPELLNPEEN